MANDFYPFVAPEANPTLAQPASDAPQQQMQAANTAPTQEAFARYAAKIAIYDNMLSTPHVLTVNPNVVRAYLDELTNTVYREMKNQGGGLPLMVIREIVENFIHAQFTEPTISILDNGCTIRFADQGPGIKDKERAFDFGFTSATDSMKRYIRGTGSGFPVIQEYLETSGGVISIEDNMGAGTVITVTVDQKRAAEIWATTARGATVRGKVVYAEEATAPVVAAPAAPVAAAAPAAAPAQNPAFAHISVSARGENILSYLASESKCGPSELVASFGSSLATWSRELSQLSNTGLVIKHGQKYQLTQFGQTWVDSNL